MPHSLDWPSQASIHTQQVGIDVFRALLTILDSAAIGHLTTRITTPAKSHNVSTELSNLSSAPINHLTSSWQETLSHD